DGSVAPCPETKIRRSKTIPGEYGPTGFGRFAACTGTWDMVERPYQLPVSNFCVKGPAPFVTSSDIVWSTGHGVVSDRNKWGRPFYTGKFELVTPNWELIGFSP